MFTGVNHTPVFSITQPHEERENRPAGWSRYLRELGDHPHTQLQVLGVLDGRKEHLVDVSSRRAYTVHGWTDAETEIKTKQENFSPELNCVTPVCLPCDIAPHTKCFHPQYGTTGTDSTPYVNNNQVWKCAGEKDRDLKYWWQVRLHQCMKYL